MANTGTSEMLLATYNFAVEVDGITVAYFKKCTGLSSGVKVITHEVVNATGQQVTQKLAGHADVESSEINLTKSLDGNTYLSDWFKEVQDGKFDSYRRNGSIVMYDPQGTETARWNFVNGWPKEWKASDLDAGSDEVATEEVTITHEGLTRA